MGVDAHGPCAGVVGCPPLDPCPHATQIQCRSAPSYPEKAFRVQDWSVSDFRFQVPQRCPLAQGDGHRRDTIGSRSGRIRDLQQSRNKRVKLNGSPPITTPVRWIQAYATELGKRIRSHPRPSNGSWRVDEIYIRVKGHWTYLCRAMDSRGQTIDFLRILNNGDAPEGPGSKHR